MGCGASRSSPTSPAAQSLAPGNTVDNTDWILYAPGRQTCVHCGQLQTLPRYLAYSSPSHSSPTSSSHSSLASSSTWLGNSTDYSAVALSTPPSSSNSSSHGGASRTYSLLSTPTFHSPSSHPRNKLTLDPTLFTNPSSPTVGEVCRTKIDTDCASQFSGSHSPSFASSVSSYSCAEKRYPLAPLSVRTEPFPR